MRSAAVQVGGAAGSAAHPSLDAGIDALSDALARTAGAIAVDTDGLAASTAGAGTAYEQTDRDSAARMSGHGG